MNLQQYLLVKLAEEATEVAHRALKCAQYGMNHTQPQQPTNWERLFKEITDMNLILELMKTAGIFDYEEIDNQDESNHYMTKWFDVLAYARLSSDSGQLRESSFYELERLMNGRPS